ncbi:velvet factor-domain-containing protein [Suillus paluster]|uniref:velvet factor-domain-containing protein n=1 Tax=Suillus paluster TaxID=48578 RepID=UPI001B87E8E5|nr:velvet factor-domain-containing protein [Suillus paluster]KAG1746679.1 velvet factor-domain-containing protein [Suillus paluster]
MRTCPIDSYWSRQYSWEKVSTKNGSRLSVEGDVARTRQLRPVTPITPVKCISSSYKKLFHELPWESPQGSPRSVAASDHSNTQSPPSSWALPSQSESSSQQGQASSTDRASPSMSSQYISSQSRVQHSSFLNDGQTRSYHLDVVQHPQRTAEFGSASLSRLPLAPPVVVQLIVRDRFGHSIIPEMELPFLIAHLSLFTDDGSRPLDMGSSPNGEAPPRRLLYGNLVSSPHQLRDLQGRLGLYFLFPDASIRWRGRFQLGISLLRISETDASGAMSIASQGTVLAQARTRSFDVYAHENYVAPRKDLGLLFSFLADAAPPLSKTAPTRLTQSFLRQGARIHAFTPNGP